MLVLVTIVLTIFLPLLRSHIFNQRCPLFGVTVVRVCTLQSSQSVSVVYQVFQWIQELTSPSTREHALIELSRKREVLPDLAPMLWHSFGTMAALLQEIVMIYPVINPPTLTVCIFNP